MSHPEALAQDARDRAPHLESDALKTIRAYLADGGAKATSDDRGLVEWALNNSNAAAMREQWVRELVSAAANATAPIWAAIDDARMAAELAGDWLHACRQATSENPEPFDGSTDPAEHRKAWLGMANFLNQDGRAEQAAHIPDIDMLYGKTDISGRCWAVSVVLSAPALRSDTIADVWTMIDAAANSSSFGLQGACWEWLGGHYGIIHYGEGKVPDGWEVTARWIDSDGNKCRRQRPSDPPRYLRAFTRDLWRQRWQEEAANAYHRSAKISALTTRTTTLVASLLSPASTMVRAGSSLEIVGSDGRKLGELLDDDVLSVLRGWSGTLVDTDLVHAAADNLARAGRTATAVAGFWHALRTTTDRYQNGLDLRAEWPAWKAWAEEVADLAELRLNNEFRAMLCDFAWYGNTVQLMLFDGRIQRGLWTVTAPDPRRRGPAPRGSSAAVAFRYGDLLDPGWSRRENPLDRNRGVRLLALPDRLPVAIADRAAKGPAQLYSLLMLAEVCDGSDHKHVNDGAVVTLAHRHRLADRAGLSHDNELRQLRGGLLDRGLLIEVEPDRYALGDEKARAMRAHTRPQPRRRSQDRE